MSTWCSSSFVNRVLKNIVTPVRKVLWKKSDCNENRCVHPRTKLIKSWLLIKNDTYQLFKLIFQTTVSCRLNCFETAQKENVFVHSIRAEKWEVTNCCCWSHAMRQIYLTTIGGRPRPECFLSGRLRWTLLPKERYDESLSGRGSNT